MTPDLAIAGYIAQAVLLVLLASIAVAAVRLGLDAARDFHRAGLARLAAHERRAGVQAADSRRIA